jgi:hypothetical protein
MPLQRLELYAGKLARTVLRGLGAGNRAWLPDKWWREDGAKGLFDGHKGGRPVVLTPELVACAVEIAKGEALTLAKIKLKVLEQHPDAPDFSLDRLSLRLREHGMSFKRCRLSLKKSG